MTDLLFLYAESPVHAGGAESIGSVDLPIQREAATRLPTIWGQSLKGAIREHASRRWVSTDVDAIFGEAPPLGGDAPSPGALSVGDARLVAFPVPTLENTFAWVTSPLALGRVSRLTGLAGITTQPSSPRAISPDWCLPSAASEWPESEIALGDLVVRPTAGDGDDLGKWAAWLACHALPGPTAVPDYFRDKLGRHLVLVDDSVLSELSQQHTEVVARVRLASGSKTVDPGGLWYEEHLPAESILVAPIDWRGAGDAHPESKHRALLRELLHEQILVVGGNESVGKGLMWCTFARRGDGDA